MRDHFLPSRRIEQPVYGVKLRPELCGRNWRVEQPSVLARSYLGPGSPHSERRPRLARRARTSAFKHGRPPLGDHRTRSYTRPLQFSIRFRILWTCILCPPAGFVFPRTIPYRIRAGCACLCFGPYQAHSLFLTHGFCGGAAFLTSALAIASTVEIEVGGMKLASLTKPEDPGETEAPCGRSRLWSPGYESGTSPGGT